MGCYYVIGLRVDHRRANAAGLQETLTRYGCNIRLRVGLHEAGEGRCADDGVILLQVCGEQGEVERLMAALEATPGVTAKLMDLNGPAPEGGTRARSPLPSSARSFPRAAQAPCGIARRMVYCTYSLHKGGCDG